MVATRAASARAPMRRAFAPLVDDDASVLVLGSMPSVSSLRENAYYAHPRNAFWPLMSDLFAWDPGMPYARRCHALTRNGVALWDVLRACRRRGSLDADIESDSVEVNAFAEFFARHPGIAWVFFNGAAAQALYRRHVAPSVADCGALRYQRLPSTSPAATMPVAEKRAAWLALRVATRAGRPQ